MQLQRQYKFPTYSSSKPVIFIKTKAVLVLSKLQFNFYHLSPTTALFLFQNTLHFVIKSVNFFYMYLFLLGVREQHSICGEIRGQHVGLLTLLPICESLRLNSEHREEWEYFYPLKHFTGPICNYLHLCHWHIHFVSLKKSVAIKLF